MHAVEEPPQLRHKLFPLPLLFSLDPLQSTLASYLQFLSTTDLLSVTMWYFVSAFSLSRVPELQPSCWVCQYLFCPHCRVICLWMGHCFGLLWTKLLWTWLYESLTLFWYSFWMSCLALGAQLTHNHGNVRCLNSMFLNHFIRQLKGQTVLALW